MTKKIFWSIFAVAMAVFLACVGIIMLVTYSYFSEVQHARLKDQTDLAVHGVELGGMEYLDNLEYNDYRITLIDKDGNVLFDNIADAKVMGNHGDREEVAEAIAYGVGESVRFSDTIATKTLYHAVELADGTILRLSVNQLTVGSLLLGMIRPILIVFIIALVLSLLLANNLSKRIVGPMNTIDLDHPMENDAYEELAPLLMKIEHQHRQIQYQKTELERKHDEFSHITNSMNEGLVLLNADGVVLSINNAAKTLFGADRHCVGKDFLTVDRSVALQNVVRSALNGIRGEMIFDRDGAKYQVKASAILWEGNISGAVLLIFDVTEENLAEQQRREFTANVSHELKSPLQSIMGSAELIENGLVREEDRPMFIGRIRSEAERLVVLIDDIIRLSQLDEESEFPIEEIDLLALTKEIKEDLDEKAKRRDLTIAVAGEPVVLRGVRRLISEIVYNLCDNALKYNKDYGTVTMVVRREENSAVLIVADTGIGIPEEHLNRIFERFYRVDKSHSRETGGTGLGLSIVKHAAQFHNAVIDVKSIEGKGTTFTVKFPLQ